jgi:hypothetical protein
MAAAGLAASATRHLALPASVSLKPAFLQQWPGMTARLSQKAQEASGTVPAARFLAVCIAR